ncbi:MAG: hypothetical protein ACWGNO_00150 [Desulfobacterales bacterium]
MTTLAIAKPTVNLNNASKYYRKLNNTTLRIKIHGEDRITAKDIYLDALTCQEDWLFTTKNIADRWGIPLKTARQKMTLLSNSGLARHEKITDPKDGKIMMHIWVFYETPLPPKEGHWIYDGTKRKNNKNTTLPTAPKKGAVVPYIERTTGKQTTPAAASKTAAEIRPKPAGRIRHSPPDLQSPVVVFFDEKIEKQLEKRPDIERKWIADSLKLKKQTVENILLAIEKSEIKENPIGFIRNALEKGWIFSKSQTKQTKPIDRKVEFALSVEAKSQSEKIISGFAEGAKMMRNALKNKGI